MVTVILEGGGYGSRILWHSMKIFYLKMGLMGVLTLK
jgi:hypothetical protein